MNNNYKKHHKNKQCHFTYTPEVIYHNSNSKSHKSNKILYLVGGLLVVLFFTSREKK